MPYPSSKQHTSPHICIHEQCSLNTRRHASTCHSPIITAPSSHPVANCYSHLHAVPKCPQQGQSPNPTHDTQHQMACSAPPTAAHFRISASGLHGLLTAHCTLPSSPPPMRPHHSHPHDSPHSHLLPATCPKLLTQNRTIALDQSLHLIPVRS
jgi:hypothetical protein